MIEKHQKSAAPSHIGGRVPTSRQHRRWWGRPWESPANPLAHNSSRHQQMDTTSERDFYMCFDYSYW